MTNMWLVIIFKSYGWKRVPISVWAKRFFCPSKPPDRLWSPPSYSKGATVLAGGKERLGTEHNHPPPSSSEFKNERIPSVYSSSIPSRRGKENFTLFLFWLHFCVPCCTRLSTVPNGQGAFGVMTEGLEMI
jgi:hypothetical protein